MFDRRLRKCIAIFNDEKETQKIHIYLFLTFTSFMFNSVFSLKTIPYQGLKRSHKKHVEHIFQMCALLHSRTSVLCFDTNNINVKSNIAMQNQQRIHSVVFLVYIVCDFHSNIQRKLRLKMIASCKILFARSKNTWNGTELNRNELNMKRCEVNNRTASNLHMNNSVKVIEFL